MYILVEKNESKRVFFGNFIELYNNQIQVQCKIEPSQKTAAITLPLATSNLQ